MDNLLTAMIFLLWEINITFSPYESGRVYSLHLLPRFIGYLVLIIGCKSLGVFERYTGRKSFYWFMVFFEIIRWLSSLFLYGSIELAYWHMASVFSLCAMLYTVKTITDTLAEIEAKNSLDIGAALLKNTWRFMLVLGIVSALTMSSRTVYTIIGILAAIINIKYCVQLSRYRSALYNNIPSNTLEFYR